MCVCMSMCMRVRMCMCMYVRTYISVYIYIYVICKISIMTEHVQAQLVDCHHKRIGNQQSTAKSK